MTGRKIAVLGDMLELGQYEEQGHRKVGIRAAEVADVLVTVGKLGQLIGQAAAEVGFKNERIHSFLECDQARDFLQEFLQEKDVVLVKGSRGMRMDKIVAALETEHE
jgi:UDP-N-acetylmuramoyl-tripeptide--D-alanyl-D-alanine ligase